MRPAPPTIIRGLVCLSILRAAVKPSMAAAGNASCVSRPGKPLPSPGMSLRGYRLESVFELARCGRDGKSKMPASLTLSLASGYTTETRFSESKKN